MVFVVLAANAVMAFAKHVKLWGRGCVPSGYTRSFAPSSTMLAEICQVQNMARTTAKVFDRAC
jgi:hypothetical protein